MHLHEMSLNVFLVSSFRLLLLAPEYSLDIQARIPAALCTVHNFILVHNPKEGDLPQAPVVVARDGHHLNHTADAVVAEVAGGAQGTEANHTMRDDITQAMWMDYQHVLAARCAAGQDSDDESFDSEDNVDLSDDA
jgi:hypothetical protein